MITICLFIRKDKIAMSSSKQGEEITPREMESAVTQSAVTQSAVTPSLEMDENCDIIHIITLVVVVIVGAPILYYIWNNGTFYWNQG